MKTYGVVLITGIVAVLLGYMRSATAWKLAQQTIAYADWDGFCELASPGAFSFPGGALLYAARVAALSGVTDASPWFLGAGVIATALVMAVCVPALRKGGGLAGLCLPLVAQAGPLLLAGTGVWVLFESALGWQNMFALAVVCAIVGSVRAVRSRFGERSAICAAMAVAALLPVPIGLYAPIGVTFALFSRKGWLWMLPAWGIYFAETSLFYADCSWANAVVHGAGIVAHPSLSVLTIFNLLLFATVWLFACGMPMLMHKSAGTNMRIGDIIGIAVAAMWFAGIGIVYCCERDVQPQLAAERAAAHGDWKKVLEVTRNDKSGLQMMTAWRILALHRSGADVAAHLFDEPIMSNPITSGAQENDMDGFQILFGWGLLNPARCWIFQQMSDKVPQLRHLELLGDRAIMAGEQALARRKFRQLARVPFAGAKGRERLEFMKAHKPGELPHDLVAIAADARVFEDNAAMAMSPFFALNIETQSLVLNRLLSMREAPRHFLPAVISAMLVAKKYDRIVREQRILDVLYPNGTLPLCVREALEIAGNAISPRRDEFRRDRKRVKTKDDADAFTRKWACSYYFYAECVQ